MGRGLGEGFGGGWDGGRGILPDALPLVLSACVFVYCACVMSNKKIKTSTYYKQDSPPQYKGYLIKVGWEDECC